MLLKRLLQEKETKLKGGIYHRTQIDFCYNSNHIEGSQLTHEQTRYIFETNTIGITQQAVKLLIILRLLMQCWNALLNLLPKR